MMSSIGKKFGGKTQYKQLEFLHPNELKDNVVLVVIDGLGYEFLKTRKDSFLYKNTKEKMTSVFPSTTASAITTFSTGLAPKQHAITGWFTHLKELGCVSAILPFVPRIGGVDFETLGVNKRELLDTKGFSEKINTECISVTPSELKDSEYNTQYFKNILHYNSMEGFIRQIKRAVNGNQRFVYAYWPYFDKLCHENGVGSKITKDHLRELDTYIKRLKNLKNTSVIITSDHGFMNASKTIKLENHPRLKECLSLTLCGEARAAYCYVYPSKTRQFEEYVNKNLSKYCYLYTREEIINEGWYGLYKPHDKLFDRIGDYVLLMKEGYVIKDKLLNEELSSDKGFHGGVSKEEMHVPLIVL